MAWLISIIIIIISVAVPFNSTSDIAWEDETGFVSMSGCAAYYSAHTMESTAVTLGYIEATSDYDKWLTANGYIGAVAVYRVGDRGKDVHILWPDGTIDGPYASIDVVASHHYELGLDRNRVIDVDYNTAMLHDMKGPMAVTILYESTPLFDAVFDGENEINIGITTAEYEGCIGQYNGEKN